MLIKSLKKINFDALVSKYKNDLLDRLIAYRNEIKTNSILYDEIRLFLYNLLNEYTKYIKFNKDYFDDTLRQIINTIKENDETLNSKCVKKYLISEFNDKIYNVRDDNYESKISVGFHYGGNGAKNNIKNYRIIKSIKVDGHNNSFFIDGIEGVEPINNKVLYYDGLNVDYNLDLNFHDDDMELLKFNHKALFDKEINFYDYYGDNMDDNELNELFGDFGDIGKVYVSNEEPKTLYKNVDYKSEINPHQLAQGLKGLLVFRQLLIKKRLEEKDILILDEPEVNLHPKWQVAFAKLIIKLQLKYKLTILLCSHSPFFIEAINVFSRYYNIADKTKFYLSRKEPNGYNTINNVTNNIKEIFKSLAEPYFDIRKYENDEQQCIQN